jgi:hypothetical protein
MHQLARDMNATVPELMGRLGSWREFVDWLVFYKVEAAPPRKKEKTPEEMLMTAEILNRMFGGKDERS